MEFAREIMPGASKIGLLTNLSDPKAPPQAQELLAAGRSLELEPQAPMPRLQPLLYPRQAGSITRDGVMSIGLFFYAAVRSKLRKIGPKVIYLLLVLNAGENHFGTWNHPLWVLDIFLESSLIPNNPRILICV